MTTNRRKNPPHNHPVPQLMNRAATHLCLLLLCAFTVNIVAADRLSRIGGFIGATPREEHYDPRKDPANRDPYRRAGDRYWSLAPLFPAGVGRHPSLPGWAKLSGTVGANGDGGIFLDTHDYSNHGDLRRVFVKNYPYQLPDGRRISLYALRDGIMQYRTIEGGTATVAQYDYGAPYDPLALAAEAKAKATSNALAIATAAQATNKIIIITNFAPNKAP